MTKENIGKNVESKEQSPSVPLLSVYIRQSCRNKGETLQDLRSYLGISYIHMTSLMSGQRNFSGLKEEQQRRLAKYIGISFAQFYMYLGILKPEDFFVSDSFEDRIELVLGQMRLDKNWSAMIPSNEEFVSLPKSVQLLIVLMYEQISKQSLLEKMDMIDMDGKS